MKSYCSSADCKGFGDVSSAYVAHRLHKMYMGCLVKVRLEGQRLSE